MFDKLKEAKKEKELNRQKMEILKIIMDEKAIKLMGSNNILDNRPPAFEKMTYEEGLSCVMELAKLYQISEDVRVALTKDIELFRQFDKENIESDLIKTQLSVCKNNGYVPYFTTNLLYTYSKEKLINAADSMREITNRYTCLLGKKEQSKMTDEQVKFITSKFKGASAMFSMMFPYLGLCDSESRFIVTKNI